MEVDQVEGNNEACSRLGLISGTPIVIHEFSEPYFRKRCFKGKLNLMADLGTKDAKHIHKADQNGLANPS